MKYNFKKSFTRSIKKLPAENKEEIKRLAFKIIDLVATGEKPSKGHGLTRLRKDYWETRTTIRERILFKLTNDCIHFILAGNHNDVKKFLKSIKKNPVASFTMRGIQASHKNERRQDADRSIDLLPRKPHFKDSANSMSE